MQAFLQWLLIALYVIAWPLAALDVKRGIGFLIVGTCLFSLPYFLLLTARAILISLAGSVVIALAAVCFHSTWLGSGFRGGSMGFGLPVSKVRRAPSQLASRPWRIVLYALVWCIPHPLYGHLSSGGTNWVSAVSEILFGVLGFMVIYLALTLSEKMGYSKPHAAAVMLEALPICWFLRCRFLCQAWTIPMAGDGAAMTVNPGCRAACATPATGMLHGDEERVRSETVTVQRMVGSEGLEPPTSCL